MTRRLLLLLVGISVMSASGISGNDSPLPRVRLEPAYARMLDTLGLRGTIVTFDSNENVVLVGDSTYLHRRFLPASTFKIPNTLIGLETGVLHRDHVFRWDSTEYWNAAWNEDLALAKAFRVSCVPCYQSVARTIGRERMTQWLDRLRFGRMIVTDTTIDSFWLRGSSTISPIEQLDFLRRLHDRQLPLSTATYDDFAYIFTIANDGRGTFSGKTGTSANDDSVIGWFAGWYTTASDVRFVVILIEAAPDIEMSVLTEHRLRLAKQVLMR